MKCMITGQEFDEHRKFPPLTEPEKAFGNLEQRKHAEEASLWHYVQLLVDGKEVLAGHLAPDVSPQSLSLTVSK